MVRVDVVGASLAHAVDISVAAACEIQSANDGTDDRVLHACQLAGLSVEGSAPQRDIVRHAHQFRGDVKSRARATDASLQHGAHAKLCSTLARLSTFQLLRRSSRLDGQPRYCIQGVAYVVGDAVLEIIERRVATLVLERHDSNRANVVC